MSFRDIEVKALARATRYRNLAEEIRTTMDQMGSGTARETMRLVAQSYEALARHAQRKSASHSDEQVGSTPRGERPSGIPAEPPQRGEGDGE
jgi:hypothetical protein